MLSDTTASILLGATILAVALLAAFALASLARLRREMSDVSSALAAGFTSGGMQLHARLDGVSSHLNLRLDGVTGQLNERLSEAAETLARGLAENAERLDRRLAENTTSLNERLNQTLQLAQQSSRTVGERLDTVNRVVGDVHASLGQLGEANRRIFEVGQSIASLQQVLQAPKLRGGLGELLLAEVLAQILTPEHFELRHRFRSGETVDAVVRLGDGLVPIDSKFPLESFRRMLALTDEGERQRERKVFARSVRHHVDSIASKYILPDEGTFGFAFMYIPAENVYYEVILRDEALGDGGSLLEHALSRHVIPVSPSSFYAYLQSILLGLRGMRIEQRAREIQSSLARLQSDFAKFGECFDTLGNHLKNARNTYDRADGMRKKFEVKLESSAQLGPGPAEEARPRREALESIPLFQEDELDGATGDARRPRAGAPRLPPRTADTRAVLPAGSPEAGD